MKLVNKYVHGPIFTPPSVSTVDGTIGSLVSPGPLGGYRALMALRQVLELGCGATVLPEQVAVRDAANAFEADDSLRDARSAEALKALLSRLVDAARYLR